MFIPQPKFILRKPKDNKPTAIQCHLRFNGERIVFSIEEKIHPDEYDSFLSRDLHLAHPVSNTFISKILFIRHYPYL